MSQVGSIQRQFTQRLLMAKSDTTKERKILQFVLLEEKFMYTIIYENLVYISKGMMITDVGFHLKSGFKK